MPLALRQSLDIACAWIKAIQERRPVHTEAAFSLGAVRLAVRIGFFRTASQQRQVEQDRRDYDRRRAAISETRRLYWTARWRAIAKDQLLREPLCIMCRAEGMVTPATICDHVIPHRGDVFAFWNNPRQSLCVSHHSSEKQAEERTALKAFKAGRPSQA